MPYRDGRLTKKEEAFAKAYAETGFNIAAAEKLAGYAPRAGYDAASRPQILARAEEYARTQLLELDLLGIQWARSVLEDPKKPDTIKRDVWNTVSKRRAAVPDDRPKDIAEMSLDELAAKMEELEKERAAIAVDVTPDADLFA